MDAQERQNPKPKLRTLDLFSGIGGFSLGLEACGRFQTVAFCEIEPYARCVLARHWPHVPIYGDVRGVTGDVLRTDGVFPIEAVCGGFPCQDISTAGKGLGLAGERSGLWSELCRLLCDLRPRVAIVENVAALLYRGLDQVLGDLAEIGYDAEWHCIPASALGAPHQRDRIWIVAYPVGTGRACGGTVGNVENAGRADRVLSCQPEDRGGLLADADRIRCPDIPVGYETLPILGRLGSPAKRAWPSESGMGRMADGIPDQLDRLRGLGNAVVPQVVEWIGSQIDLP